MVTITKGRRAVRVDERNPFTKPEHAPVVEPVEDVNTHDQVQVSPGPVQAPGGPPPVSGARVLHRSKAREAGGGLWVVGLHGGAGATTTARLLGSRALATPSGRFSAAEPAHAMPGALPDSVGPTLLVARVSGVGLARAHQAAQEWASGVCPTFDLLGLMLLDDGLRPSPQLAPLMKQVSKMYPRTWRVPWVQSWYFMASPPVSEAPRRIRRTAIDVHQWSLSRPAQR